MDNESEKATGLREVEVSNESGELSEWDRDRLLVELTIRLGRIRRGVFSSYGRLLLPFAVAFPLCGFIIYLAFKYSQKPLPLGFLYLGDFFIIIGIFLVILVLALLVFDFIRSRYMESLTGQEMSRFECMHYGFLNDAKGPHPACMYFNHTLDDYPLCIVCPIYRMRK